MSKDISQIQRDLCAQYHAEFVPSAPSQILGISLSVKSATWPLNGLRHVPEKGESGWYIWAGDYLPDDDFFKTLHVSHISNWTNAAEKFLGLAPGWRFLVAPGYEDVWFDESLLVAGAD